MVRLGEIALQRQRGHSGPMTTRATKRPKEFTKPEHWSNDPAPKPEKAKAEEDPAGLSPTRYGDWVNKGIAIDF
jgi:hypothetical protein